MAGANRRRSLCRPRVNRTASAPGLMGTTWRCERWTKAERLDGAVPRFLSRQVHHIRGDQQKVALLRPVPAFLEGRAAVWRRRSGVPSLALLFD
jgi:hypothetical protein